MGKRTDRALRKKKLSEKTLSKYGEGGDMLANKDLKQSENELGLLLRIFKLGRGEASTSQKRKVFVDEIEKRFAQSGSSIRPPDLGVKNWSELAELVVKRIEGTKISSKTFRAFIAQKRIEGHQHPFRGMLFNLYVRNFEPLQQDFKKMANGVIKDLNDPKIRSELLNAKGEKPPIPKSVEFGQPRKAQKIRVIKKNGTVEFMDDAFVSNSGKGDSGFWGFLVEIESKTSSSAKEFGRQIGFAQLRFMADDVEKIEMVVEGFKIPIPVEPKKIIFSPRSIDRNAVTLLSPSQWGKLVKDEQIDLTEALKTRDKDKIYVASGFRYQSTSKGLGETFRRITLAINTDELNKLVRAIIPDFSKKH